MQQHSEQLTVDIEKARRLVILGLFAGLVLFVLFEALRGEQFWNKVKGEGNLWNYGSSLQYFMAGQMAVVNAVLLGYYRRRLTGEGRRSWRWVPWAAAGAAFVFFACDEMLEVHEKLGLAMERSMPWLRRGYSGKVDNLIFSGYAVGAVLFTILFLRGLPTTWEARKYYIAGLLTIAMASVLDLVPRRLYMGYLPLRETEELLELFAGFSFTAAFISSGAFMLTSILRGYVGVREVAPLAVGEGSNGRQS